MTPEPICALTVLSTVTSHPGGHAVIDAGSKSLTTETGAHGHSLVDGYGLVESCGLVVTRVSEEHGIVPDPQGSLNLGDRIQIVPNHACPVVNLFDRAYVVDGLDVCEEIRIDARGCSQ